MFHVPRPLAGQVSSEEIISSGVTQVAGVASLQQRTNDNHSWNLGETGVTQRSSACKPNDRQHG